MFGPFISYSHVFIVINKHSIICIFRNVKPKYTFYRYGLLHSKIGKYYHNKRGIMTNKVFLQTLGKRIAVLRKQKRLSQEEFAEVSGKMINTISNVERGLSDPKITTLLSFANALNVPVQDLLTDISTQNKPHSDTLKTITRLLEGQDEKTLKTALKQIEALLEMK
ncbi:MAG: helix-turn-helix transcriptional regulator [Alphaproteobacteria bacterium]|nr:helix-turn-helix transcriptional regulator [Alphaproteobacteria bacterium]